MSLNDDRNTIVGSGAVEVREDAPLKAGGRGRRGGCGGGAACGGPRFIVACFALFTAAVTLALLTQIYFGDYQLVPHGAVATASANCSTVGAAALKAGGRALHAAAAAALCLAVLHPHRAPLDSSGALLLWEYRKARSDPPVVAEWGGAESGAESGAARGEVPRLLCALAELLATAAPGLASAVSWSRVLQPAIDLARSGFAVSPSLSEALAARGAAPGAVLALPVLADYLQQMQLRTSAEVSSMCGGSTLVRRSTATGGTVGPVDGTDGTAEWRVWAAGPEAATLTHALTTAFEPPSGENEQSLGAVDKAIYHAASSVWAAESANTGAVQTPASSGLAVVDSRDTYVSLVIGVSKPFGSEAAAPASVAGGVGAPAWWRDVPLAPLDLTPAVLYQSIVCGTRYVMGGESTLSVAQAGAALTALGQALPQPGVERARLAAAGGALAAEPGRPPAPPLAALVPPAPAAPASSPAVNVVQQRGDELASHSDSRAGGIAVRF